MTWTFNISTILINTSGFGCINAISGINNKEINAIAYTQTLCGMQKMDILKLGKSYNMVNSYLQNRQQPRLEVLMRIAKIFDIDVKELIVSNKEKKK
ncbi:helix-turn-helix domain-containing protein [Tenuifilum thalassicum]|nr:helix-turn-helix transcriptional regulator [Tenuifilum thalassicum]